MTRTLAAALLASLVALPSHAFIAENSLVVEGSGTGDFTVPYKGLSGPRAFWCAAGDYAISILGVSPATRIYRTSPPPRRGGEAMDFSLDVARAVDPGLLRLSDSPGLTAGYARFLCDSPAARR
ncbi:hypothetical protein SAMN04488012_11225 [Palleronia salina]|uniref:Uncharacterized protein n=2 Tax=Palleronia TaxID=315422 RepID=A0A1M6KJE2_9RHOB|nr:MULTISPECIES: hypothetical protein [Palleronia]SEO07614.1 hypothetical protein SAMN04488011_11157 [Palleronia pelagia]SHJ58961.1 hypothetical protein SAMN04488012_11225 [Palleronia salina]